MAGGSGTRFWPESRRCKPKQLLNIMGDGTMIRATVLRILQEIPFERMLIITAASHADEIRVQVPELNGNQIVAEPMGRNTAPCIALAAYKLHKIDPDGVMAVLPADHVIEKEREFRTVLRIATEAASMGDHLITFGVRPNRPETGYGYIKLGPVRLELQRAEFFQVERFVEKPCLSLAQEYLSAGDYLWNSGMFVWKIKSIIKAFEQFLPSVARSMEEIAPALNTPLESAVVAKTYSMIEPISIDYGIMEKAGNVLTMPVDVQWSDVGSWASLEDVWEKDQCCNATKGRVMFIEGKSCIVSSPHKITALIGVEDLIVVDTPDALMICRKDRAQDVKRLQELLEEQGYEDLL
jgi:mannose-1-phosphate guanylyltransferase